MDSTSNDFDYTALKIEHSSLILGYVVQWIIFMTCSRAMYVLSDLKWYFAWARQMTV